MQSQDKNKDQGSNEITLKIPESGMISAEIGYS